ncbi:hypothetical protein AZI86_12740 [Bdellovibrio bacteriovorus]|uniref:GP-PDE domain-containing protein n=2 Tax=Bdellovibrio bacteriovorus TaxID=959 RepID=A0A150WKB2_BDEBC|nr:hypothetical protein AZI86_12740 [Bdellovibrio bacteriovorus]
MTFGLVAVLVLSALVIHHHTWKAQSWPENSLTPPLYQGHRGYWKEGARENTRASFQAAQKRGLKMIELDVRLSKGGVPVVFHDSDLKRIGNSEKLVLDLSADEMLNLVQAPTLESVLTDLESPQFINIELKTGSIFDGSLEKAVSEVVKKTQSQRRILFSSFNPIAIWRLSHLLPEVPRALLATKEIAEGNRFYLRHMWLAPYINTNALHLDYNYVTEEDLRAWKKRGIPVALWTVNDATKAEAFLKAGAISIISDTLYEGPLSAKTN